MNKFGVYFNIFVCTVIYFVFLYCVAHDSGFYCDYCHKGGVNSKTDAIMIFGNKPCEASKDSMHHFSWWMTAPKYKAKYVK